jgi:hypothetical protein
MTYLLLIASAFFQSGEEPSECLEKIREIRMSTDMASMDHQSIREKIQLAAFDLFDAREDDVKEVIDELCREDGENPRLARFILLSMLPMQITASSNRIVFDDSFSEAFAIPFVEACLDNESLRMDYVDYLRWRFRIGFPESEGGKTTLDLIMHDIFTCKQEKQKLALFKESVVVYAELFSIQLNRNELSSFESVDQAFERISKQLVANEIQSTGDRWETVKDGKASGLDVSGDSEVGFYREYYPALLWSFYPLRGMSDSEKAMLRCLPSVIPYH